MNPKDVLLRREFWVLVVLLGLVGLVWGFVELADEVVEGETHAIDKQVILMMRNPGDMNEPLGPDWVQESVRDMTALGGVTVLVLLALSVTVFLWLEGKPRASLFVFASFVVGWLISSSLKWGFDRPRPDLVPHGAHVYTASFPSGHSMMSAVTYLTLGALAARVHRRVAVKAYFLGIALLLTLMVGVSRVYLAVHWPSDVLAGWTAGAAWAMLCWLLASWLQSRGRLEE